MGVRAQRNRRLKMRIRCENKAYAKLMTAIKRVKSKDPNSLLFDTPEYRTAGPRMFWATEQRKAAEKRVRGKK